MSKEQKIQVAVFWFTWFLFLMMFSLVVYHGGTFKIGFIKIGDARLLPFLLLLAAMYLLPDLGMSRKIRAANFGLVVLSILFACLVSELVIRFYLQNTQGFNSIQQLHNPNPAGYLHTRSHHPLLTITQFSADKRLIYELKPNVDKLFDDKRLRTNSTGIRSDKEFLLEKQKGVKRIVGIGDSGMWGWGIEQNNGYMEIMERVINEQEKSFTVEMVNLAVPGYNTFQEFTSLKLKGLKYKPDIVVIGWCDNDFDLPFFMYTRKDHWKQKHSYVYNLLFNRPYFLEMITPEVLKLGDMPKDLVDPEVISHSGKEGVRKTLESTLRLAEENQLKVVLFGPLEEDIKKICKKIGMPMIDIYDLKETNPPKDCQIFFMHPRQCGHEILGNFLAKKIQDYGWL